MATRKKVSVKFDIGNREERIMEGYSFDPKLTQDNRIHDNNRTRKEVFKEYLNNEFSLEYVCSSKNIDLLFGDLCKDDIKKKVEIVFNRFDFASKAGVIKVDDLGFGWIFSRGKDGNLIQEEQYTGKVGKKGTDIKDHIEEDYGMTINIYN